MVGVVLSVIIPVKLPEPYLPTLLSQLAETISVPYEVLVQTEKGLGYAVMCGVQRSRGDVIVVLDADGSHPVSAIPFMYEIVASKLSQIVVASRYHGGATQDSFSRQFISRVYCLFAKKVFGLSVQDSMSGFVAARREVLLKYPIGVKGFKWGLELLVRSKGRAIVTEYPILFASRKAGKSKASPIEAVNTLLFMGKLLKTSLKSTINR
jgi:dolichol-phosphate mannosyltransferase